MSTPSSEHTSLLGQVTDKTNVDQENDEKVSFMIGLYTVAIESLVSTYRKHLRQVSDWC